MNNKGFTLIECVISFALLSIILIVASKYIKIAFNYYEQVIQEDKAYANAEIVYDFISERVHHMSNVEIGFEDTIETNEIILRGNFTDLVDEDGEWKYGHIGIGPKAIQYSQYRSSVAYCDVLGISKAANSGLITIKYTVKGLEDVFVINLDLEDRGVNAQSVDSA
ncbi:PulJ/GspJ family protein [Candidatus Epulonipiscium viviparus]|uniref:PulJ/GspJ family protein n=1 Tax=Candidatus Epulonipiscium viviparus TaxID=420336 RepID=UPI00016BFEE2|nr:prepilin-type N-terminal cleavage/methylation domain-containing protein [Candidatus Epulopiscium viviparus]